MRFHPAALLLAALALSSLGCAASTSTCSAETCAGCCRGDECHGGSTVEACGTGGLNCDVCVGGQICAGRCVFSETGGGAGGGRGAAGGGAGGGASGGGTGGGVGGGVGGGGAVGGGSGGGATGGGGGGGGGGGAAGPDWVNLGFFTTPPPAMQSIEDLSLLFHGGRLQLTYRIHNSTATPPNFYTSTLNPLAPAWQTVRIDSGAPGSSQLMAGAGGVVYVGWCDTQATLMRVATNGIGTFQLFTPCGTFGASTTTDVVYRVTESATDLSISRSTTAGNAWSSYTGFPKAGNRYWDARLRVKQNGNLVFTAIDDRDGNGSGGPQGDYLVTAEYDGTSWAWLGPAVRVDSFDFEMLLDRQDRPCVAFMKPSVGVVVECHEGGAWVQQGPVVRPMSVLHVAMTVDSTNALYVGIITNTLKEGIVYKLAGGAWGRVGWNNGCLRSPCRS